MLSSNFIPHHLARIKNFQEICCKLNWLVTGIKLARSQAYYPFPEFFLNNLPNPSIKFSLNKTKPMFSYAK